MKRLGSEVVPRCSYDHLFYLRSDGKNEWTIRARNVNFGRNVDNKIANASYVLISEDY